jgi:hypothetical protein
MDTDRIVKQELDPPKPDETTRRYFDPNKFQEIDMRDFCRSARRKRIAGLVLFITLVIAALTLISWYLQ